MWKLASLIGAAFIAAMVAVETNRRAFLDVWLAFLVHEHERATQNNGCNGVVDG